MKFIFCGLMRDPSRHDAHSGSARKVQGADIITDFPTEGHRKIEIQQTHDGARRAPPRLSGVECSGMAAVLFRFGATTIFLVVRLSNTVFIFNFLYAYKLLVIRISFVLVLGNDDQSISFSFHENISISRQP
jgi:hypothetical protein